MDQMEGLELATCKGSPQTLPPAALVVQHGRDLGKLSRNGAAAAATATTTMEAVASGYPALPACGWIYC